MKKNLDIILVTTLFIAAIMMLYSGISNPSKESLSKINPISKTIKPNLKTKVISDSIQAANFSPSGIETDKKATIDNSTNGDLITTVPKEHYTVTTEGESIGPNGMNCLNDSCVLLDPSKNKVTFFDKKKNEYKVLTNKMSNLKSAVVSTKYITVAHGSSKLFVDQFDRRTGRWKRKNVSFDVLSQNNVVIDTDSENKNLSIQMSTNFITIDENNSAFETPGRIINNGNESEFIKLWFQKPGLFMYNRLNNKGELIETTELPRDYDSINTYLTTEDFLYIIFISDSQKDNVLYQFVVEKISLVTNSLVSKVTFDQTSNVQLESPVNIDKLNNTVYFTQSINGELKVFQKKL